MGVVRRDEVEPIAREAFDPPYSQAGCITEFTNPRGTGAGPSFDVAQRCDCRLEEASADTVTALGSAVVRPVDQVRLGLWPQSCLGHVPSLKARSRSSSTTASVAARPSPDSSPSVINARSRAAAWFC